MSVELLKDGEISAWATSAAIAVLLLWWGGFHG